MHSRGAPPSTKLLDYRADIDGLRAIAVIAVVVYHAFPRFAPSGFIGVDVFFVVSGFLITGIIERELRTDAFRFADFYARRVRRIFPALLLVLAATLAIGWMKLFSSEFEQLGKHVAGAAAFASNLLLQREAGYFDADSRLKPLLHLWSLGVEEQFYLFWPVLLVLMQRLGSRLRLALVLILAMSFFASLVAIRIDQPAAFYSPLFRCWQLAAGGLLIFAASSRRRSASSTVAAMAGFALIAIAAVAITERDRYPGWLALLPTIGTALLIAGGPVSPVNRVLAWGPLVGLGLISYPLYLWHWPLLTFARILDGPLPSREVRAGVVVLSMILATLTYLGIERPLRARRSIRSLAVGLLLSMLVLFVSGYAVFASRGAPFRAAAAAAEPFIATAVRSPRSLACVDIVNAATRPDGWYCHLGADGALPSTVVVGDSHASALLPAFEAIARDRGEGILFVSASGCPPLLGMAPRRHGRDIESCRMLNERVFELVKQQRPEQVFLVASWTYYTDGNYLGENLNVIGFGDTAESLDGSREAFRRSLALTLSRYATLGVDVHVVQRVPAQLRPATDLIRAVVTSSPSGEAIRRVSVPLEIHRRSLAFVSSVFAALGLGSGPNRRADLIDLENSYCDSDVCSFGREGVSYYFDDNHLSVSGALVAVPGLSRHFRVSASARASRSDSPP